MAFNVAANICAPILAHDPSAFPSTFGVLGADWLQLTLLALLCSLLALSLVYILTKLLGGGAAGGSAPLNAWVKFEFFQLFATAMLVVLTSSVIIFGMCSFDMSLLDNSPNSHYVNNVTGQPLNMLDIIQNYFAKLEQVAYMLFAFFVYVVGILNNMAKLALQSGPVGTGFSESPLESLLQINNLLFLMVSGFVISFLTLQVQMRMMGYISVAALYYLFPFGIFFRAFEPTRAFGGTLMGLSIALFLFYPILLVFNDYMIYGSIDDMRQELDAGIVSTDAQLGSNTDAAPTLADGQSLATELTNGGIASGISNSITFLFKPIMLYFIAAVVLPIINFTLLVEIARGLTKLLGEEMDVTNLTRLI